MTSGAARANTHPPRGNLKAALEKRNLDWIVPDWPAPPNVRALMTTRTGRDGASMNLGRANGAAAADVEHNRALLAEVCSVESLWMSQTHGTAVAVAEADGSPQLIEADAAIATRPGRAATVRVADCMPVLFTDRQGSVVGAAHAGWRGLCAGVLEATIASMRLRMNKNNPPEILAWLGPAIGPDAFEVGDDVRDAFIARDDGARHAFVPVPARAGKWLADLYALARMRLRTAGVTSIHGGDYCTFRDADRFFSYRRDKSMERMAAVIWIEPSV